MDPSGAVCMTNFKRSQQKKIAENSNFSGSVGAMGLAFRMYACFVTPTVWSSLFPQFSNSCCEKWTLLSVEHIYAKHDSTGSFSKKFNI